MVTKSKVFETDLLLTLQEEINRVCTIRNGRTDYWEPMKNSRWLRALTGEDLEATTLQHD